MAPKIGLTFRYERKAKPYRLALQEAGLDPVDLTPVTPGASLTGLSGLVLSGGADVEPGRYGQAVDGTHQPDPERDELEIRMANEALAVGMPIFAICRGMQLLNVVLGGTLHQDIGDEHTLVPPVMHRVDVLPGSRLHTILGDGVESNSRHHQAVDSLAPTLIRTATAPDGTVEGIEKPGDPFVLGVQWHPEDLPDRRLFLAFAAAVRLWK